MDPKKTVLVIDDNDLVLDAIDLLLSAERGFRTIRARGAAGALSDLQLAAIDVVVADVILAGTVTGLDICDKAIECNRAVAIVVITADPDVHGADIPARAVFLRKPFDGQRLLAAIELALQKVPTRLA